MFLHPVNVRCLLREYGSLEGGPDSITARVVETEGQTVTEVTRIYFLLFSHLDTSIQNNLVWRGFGYV